MFKSYNKIYTLGKEEVEGILQGVCSIQEKVDGANTSIWVEDGVLHCGSRNQEVTHSGFNGFVDYVHSHAGIKNYLRDNPTHRLYGEWLVRHTIAYNENAYRKFYLFDIEVDDVLLPPEQVFAVAESYTIPSPQLFAVIQDPSTADLEAYAGKSSIGSMGEGVVIKNHAFINKFGRNCYAKLVTNNFKEATSVVFGSNSKDSESYYEIHISNKYITPQRVEKIMNKIQPLLDHPLGKPDTPRISNTVYHDMITEEIWEIQDDVPQVNFSTLRKICTKKAVHIFHSLLGSKE